MKKKFIDRWWVRILALVIIPSLFGGLSSAAPFWVFLSLLSLMVVRGIEIRKPSNVETGLSAQLVDSKSKKRPAPPRNKWLMPAEGTFILLESSGNFSVGLAGESHYFEAISMAANRQSGEHAATAEIIGEPDNKFDSNAVRVEINGRTVGYIPREEAPAFRPLLDYGKSVDKRIFASCRVWVSDDDESYGSVSLDIDDPESALPPINISEVPQSAVVWPIGNTLQVSEESRNTENLKVVFEKMRDSIGRTVLFELAVDRTKPDKPEAHVLFNGLKVGELSPVSAKKFMSAIEKASSIGKRLFVRGEATGNSLAAEVRIFAKSPELLSESEVQRLLG